MTLDVAGVELPELGIGVFDDCLIIDYRMGPHWTEVRVQTLFELLRQLCVSEPGARAEIEPYATPVARRQFQRAWMRFLTTRGAV